MQRKILHTIANYYYRDGIDFSQRFDLLWEVQLHKTGRLKSFSDLLFGCECALKCHIFLSQESESAHAGSAYRDIRKIGHDIIRLADAAKFLQDRSKYNLLKDCLGVFDFPVRYSLDAHEKFFPSARDRSDASVGYSHTIGNNSWVLEIRSNLQSLLDSCANEFNGFVTDDIAEILEHENSMSIFSKDFLRK